uniref:Uncharacterized protein n=1 Tax=Knipowitschia caucasica TaxID=637954 RepID=A0AAV2K1N2_KNICA
MNHGNATEQCVLSCSLGSYIKPAESESRTSDMRLAVGLKSTRLHQYPSPRPVSTHFKVTPGAAPHDLLTQGSVLLRPTDPPDPINTSITPTPHCPVLSSALPSSPSETC